ncbi:MAG: hypothetical protein V4760_09275 [Bdellovibrionota bacterium]
MKNLVLAFALLALPLVSEARDLQKLDCTAANGLKFTYEDAPDAQVVVSYLAARRSFALTQHRVDIHAGVTGFTIANQKGLMVGLVETYQIDLKVPANADETNEFQGLGFVTKTVINMTAPVPVTSVPVGIRCSVALKN